MTDINGFLKDMTGKQVGITGNPIYVSIIQTPPSQPQELKYKVQVVEVPKIEYIVSSCIPHSALGRMWWKFGRMFGWC